MASANQEQQSNPSNHTLTMQRQQQDLVKLLAQHFHHQFYQLANNNNVNNNNGSQLPGSTPMTNAVNSRLQPLPTAFQNTPAQYASDANMNPGGSGFELNHGMNLIANANNQMLHNHILRSQATNTGRLNNLSVATNPTPESLIDFSIRNSLNPYPLNDMSIFHALGLNLTNNQLVLSLQHQQQQQTPIQTPTSTYRQYESRNDTTAEQEARHSNRAMTNNAVASNNNMIDLANDHTDGKEMLKFSINTILGRGSPSHHEATESKAVSKKQNLSIEERQNSLFERANELFKIRRNQSESNERDERSSANECDSNDSCSDSSLINASTPIPQTSNSSNLYNQTNQPPNHHIALSTNGNPSNQQLTSRNHIQAHQRSAQHTLPFLPGTPAFPWTVAARGKPRRGMMRRAVFSDSQRVGLEKRFQLQKYISKPDRKKLAEKLGLRDSQVKIWFQNRRMKWRNSKERELLSAGGSREQTLPTRNNPNPDLSDVGETIKRITAATCLSNDDLNITK